MEAAGETLKRVTLEAVGKGTPSMPSYLLTKKRVRQRTLYSFSPVHLRPKRPTHTKKEGGGRKPVAPSDLKSLCTIYGP